MRKNDAVRKLEDVEGVSYPVEVGSREVGLERMDCLPLMMVVTYHRALV